MSILNKPQSDQTGKAPKAGKTRRKSIDKRNKSLKTISITSTIIFMVILLVVNIAFGGLLGDKLKWDWTPGQMYSIGDVSKNILSSMTKDVEIVGLFNDQTDTAYKDIREMLENYKKDSGGRISLRYVDPVKFPSILMEIDPDKYLNPSANNFVVRCTATGKAKIITDSELYSTEMDPNTYQTYVTGITAEQSFTGAIKYVQSETTPVVYFTTDHKELAFETEYSLLVTVMKNNNYEVKPLATFDLAEIPADCSILIMADPKDDISTAESIMILKYLKSGGGLMVITDFSNSRFPKLNDLLLDFNLEISNDKIREDGADHRFNNDPYVIRAIAPASTITESAVDGWTLVDNVRGIIELKNTKEWIKVSAVLTTTDQGVAETSGDVNQASDLTTQNIGMISENSGSVNGSTVKESAKVMVIGSSSIFQDATLQMSNQLYNIYLFYTGIQWLANASSEDNLYIAAKTPASYGVTLGTQSVKVFTAVLIIVILPGALLLAALFVYRKRKHL
jgi:ABC-2 type transport system permease protein